jgi:hypothetical protein
MPPPPDRDRSADGRWRSDQRPPRWLALSGLLWLVTVASWLIAGTVFLAVGPPGGSTTDIVVVAGLAGLAVLVTLGWGALVARRRATRWLWRAVAAGTTVQLFTYMTAMLAAPQSPGAADDDISAGAGLVVLAIPTAVLIAALLWLGAAVGALSRVVGGLKARHR